MILILCCPRTGSSLVAKIFAMHGVYAGPIVSNKFGYTEYENTDIKQISKSQWLKYNRNRDKVFGAAMIPKKHHLEYVRNGVEPLIQGKGKWMFKTMVELYTLFLQFNPNIILIKRNEESTLDSICEKHPKDDREYIREIYLSRMRLMASIENECGAKWVDTDKLMLGNYDEIKEAVEYCGLEYDASKVREAIDPELWRH